MWNWSLPLRNPATGWSSISVSSANGSASGGSHEHPIEDVKGRLVLAVLNFEPRTIGNVLSEALVLGVQFPKAESGEATFVTPAANAKIGSKLF